MTLRAPNFLLPGPSKGPSNSTAAAADNSGNNRLSLSSYTSKCQQQLLLAVSKSIDDGSDHDEKTTSDDNNIINTNNNGKGKGNNNTSNREGSNEPSMEQCILLLESHLLGFQKSCRQKEDKHSTDGEGKKKKRKKAHHATTKQQDFPTSLNDSNIGDGDGNINEGDDDEVPPQLLRLARFFHYRWLPIKRALLRPVDHSTDGDQSPTSNNEQQSECRVEVGLKYRLRLAKACWKHGLVAAAEYEMLIASLNKVLEPSCSNVNDDINGGMKCKGQYDGVGDEVNLMERMRLALLRLPTDATITSSVSTSSSSQATATAAWRHVKEMMLECCRYWEKNSVTISMMLPPSATSVEGEDAALLTKLGVSKVVDWALTSWTALLLSQGVDCFTATSSSTMTISNSNDPIFKIEKEFATMLSNHDPNPFLLFAMAVSHRINEIISYDHLKQLSGIHVLSMARLLAKFHSRDNAEEHIMTSIITCSLVKGGGMDCLDPLSRLLAIYCCNISIVDGDAAPEDSLVGKTANRTTCADLEGRLCSKLNDEAVVERVVSSFHKEEGQQSTQQEAVVSRAKSFMEVIFSMTAHFIKCGRK